MIEGNNMSIIPEGTLCIVKKDIGEGGLSVPWLFAGEEVRVVSQNKFFSYPNEDFGCREHQETFYIVQPSRNILVIVNEEDIEIKPYPQPKKSLEEQVQMAFREGYSRGHSRGSTTARLYRRDDQYLSAIHYATREYMRELKDESCC